MSPDTTVTPTPGVDRIIRFSIAGHDFAFRRPSRADVRDTWSIFVGKLASSGAADTLNYFDGSALQWEARLEVGLLPRRRGAEVLNLGETAPAHWLVPRLNLKGDPVDHLIDFTNVSVEEFQAVTAFLAEELKKKAPSALVTSTDSAPDSTSD